MSIRRRTFKEERKGRKRIQLKVGIKSFGPISDGKITLKPLTLFIGPNNSGKSYAAMLIHSVFESYTPTALPRRMPNFMRPRLFTEYLDIRAFLKEFPELKNQIDGLKGGEELEISKQIIEKIANKIFEEIYEKRLSDEIIRSYACPLNELIRIGKGSFELKINVNSYGIRLAYQKDKLKIKEYSQLDIKIKVKATELPRITINVKKRKNEIFINLSGPWKKKEERGMSMFYLLIDIILDVLASKIFENVAIPCYYLPAARSGILQGHKALAASIVKKAPYVGIERLEIPKFSGVVSDFISSVITLPEERGPFYRLAQNFEKELIKGEIVVRTLDEYLYPEIKYSFQKTEIPLHRASSTVSELAPLFLYLKYIIEPGCILIIEEPEAHLHPENQRILAKFLVRLIRKGVNIVITTHSEYLLEQLSSFILLSKVDAKKRVERYKYSEEDFLKPDEISAYVFVYDKRSAGHKIIEVEITEEDGISDEEFLKIHEVLYEEKLKLRRDLDVES
ncbi:MAG TPA: hypothetical protein ENI35_02425 [Candidatus Desulfofervidus auxilii]|uniref:Endonuclease GajA/Old nuclease/RecF-like AAA domain-containing protein n=1 Tax=Desulfofervidus auxilii TaxID=1621989 RepID=A0A7C1W0T5_DESA2|nr:hypothetical protein [Candidatus Desulfofervidus auxilii]